VCCQDHTENYTNKLKPLLHLRNMYLGELNKSWLVTWEFWRWASKLLGHTSKFVATLMTDRSPGWGSLLGEVEIPSHLGSISSVPSFGGTIDTRTTARLWGKLDQLQLACSNSLTKMGDLWVLGWSSTLYWYDSKGSSSGSLNGAFPLSLAATSCITFENRHRYPVQPLPSLKYSGHCLVIKV